MYALVDCNNFYASCEQVFNPKLRNKPVVILSNNDGCIIARSKEAKALGIPMGAPVFQWKEALDQYEVVRLSANFTLYGDMSERVMSTLHSFHYPLHIYSIDEAFLDVSECSNLEGLGKSLRARVLQWTGILTSIGFGSTKTLAKLANDLAKKDSHGDGVRVLENPKTILTQTPIENIWGIGSKLSKSLKAQGVYTAAQLIEKSDAWIKSQYAVTGLRTAMELRGISCLSFEELPAAKKGITSSRSFGTALSSLKDIKEALATFVSRCSEKLRAQSSLAGFLSVYLVTKDFHSSSAYMRLPLPTSDNIELIKYANSVLEEIFKSGIFYRKVGVTLSDLVPSSSQQFDLFSSQKRPNVGHLIDSINQKNRKKAIFLASEGINPRWKPHRDHLSPCYTTKWEDLLKVKA